MIVRRCRPTRARAAAFLCLGLACEHANTVAPPPAAAPPPVVAPPRARVDAPLPLPDALLIAGRWSHPTALLKQLQSWGGGNLTLELWLRGRVGRPSRPVDLQAPIEFFALWNGQSEPPVLRWAISFALATADPGDIPSAPRDVPSPLGLTCAEAHALGGVPLRMVCSTSDTELLDLLPIATRALPLANLGSGDLTLRLHAQPLRNVDDATLDARTSAWLERALGVDALNRKGDAELAGLAQNLRDELRNLAQDLDGATLELAAHGEEKLLELSVLAPRAAARSELLQLFFGTGAAGIAPSDFWQMHEASEGAGYLWAVNPAPLARLRAPVGALLGTLLDFRGIPDRLQQQGRWLIERLPLPMGPIVHASGQLPASTEARSAPPPWLAEIGWEALSFAGKFSDVEAWTAQLASALEDPILGPQFGRLLRSAWGPRWVPQHVERRRPRGAHTLPRESFVLELTFAPPRGPDPDVPAPTGAAHPNSPKLFVLFVPEPDGVKIAWGAEEKFLVSLVANPGRRSASATLAGRAGLGSLNEQRTLAGGFSSLAAFASSATGPLGLGERAASAVAAAPHRGLSPILYRVSQRAEAPVLAFSASLGRETVEDLMFLIAEETPRP